MRVFVVGTGRCGSSTFYHACNYIENYGSGHESKRGSSQIGNWSFPENHIEISSNLTLAIPKLITLYPDSVWVRLKRNKADCVKSLATEVPEAMLNFAQQWWYLNKNEEPYLLEVAYQFYDFCEEIYQAMLPADSMFLDIENIKQNWLKFWMKIKAEGDYQKSVSEFDKLYNASGSRGINSYRESK